MRRLALRSALPFGVALPLLLLASGCSLVRNHDGPGDGQCMCTMEFRSVTVNVSDANGVPVSGLAVTVTNERTGAVLDVPQDAMSGSGTYAVATDGNVSDVSEAGDRLRFHAQGGGRTADAVFVVSRDACACHITKESGPESVTVE